MKKGIIVSTLIFLMIFITGVNAQSGGSSGSGGGSVPYYTYQELSFDDFSDVRISDNQFYFVVNDSNRNNLEVVFYRTGENILSTRHSTFKYKTFNGEEYVCFSSGYIDVALDPLIGRDYINFNSQFTCYDYESESLNQERYFLSGHLIGKLYPDSDCNLFDWSTCEVDEDSVIGMNFFIEDISPSENDYESRISTLESWKQTIDDWKDTLMDTISDILLTLTGHTTSIEEHEGRITSLESSGSRAGTWNNYLNYISSSTKKKMVCGYAEDNRLEHIEDLGWSCNLTYKTYSSGRERVSCRCQSIR